VLLGGCDTFPAQEAIGAALTPDGRPEVLYVSCPGEAVERVQVVKPVDNPGGGDDVVLWAITANWSATNGNTVVRGRR
jgi:hypothetical protein